LQKSGPFFASHVWYNVNNFSQLSYVSVKAGARFVAKQNFSASNSSSRPVETIVYPDIHSHV